MGGDGRARVGAVDSGQWRVGGGRLRVRKRCSSRQESRPPNLCSRKVGEMSVWEGELLEPQ